MSESKPFEEYLKDLEEYQRLREIAELHLSKSTERLLKESPFTLIETGARAGSDARNIQRYRARQSEPRPSQIEQMIRLTGETIKELSE